MVLSRTDGSGERGEFELKHRAVEHVGHRVIEGVRVESRDDSDAGF
jgi:hypothetical protein